MRNFFNDIIGQVWTLLGMFVAWIVLEGTAKEVVGWGIIAAAIVWVVTFPLRNKDDLCFSVNQGLAMPNLRN